MEKSNNTCKRKMTKLKDYTIKFWKQNKKEIYIVGEIGLTIAVTVLTIDNINQRRCVKKLTNTVINQKNKIKYLYKQDNLKTKKIEVLENMCLRKDNFFKKFISDGTKMGDSECARQLAYRKVYIKNLSKNKM